MKILEIQNGVDASIDGTLFIRNINGKLYTFIEGSSSIGNDLVDKDEEPYYIHEDTVYMFWIWINYGGKERRIYLFYSLIDNSVLGQYGSEPFEYVSSIENVEQFKPYLRRINEWKTFLDNIK